jgi:signal transduction histidine kinase
MSLQTRLTLWSVIVMALIVGFILTLDLSRDLQRRFDATLELAELIQRFAVTMVLQSTNQARGVSYRDAVAGDSKLAAELTQILTFAPTLYEIVVCDRNNRIIASSHPKRVGAEFQRLEDFRPVAERSSVSEKLRILLQARRYYQLEEALGADGEPFLYVRTVVYPRFIREEIMPTIRKDASIAVGSLLGAVVITFAFSAIAFRPLGRLGKMLDLMARGEYEPVAPAEAPSAADEFGVIASKVSLLGEQLRGVQYDYSDLRGNFERLLDELEDAVLIFGRDRRLFVASGAVEKFLRRQRADLINQPITEIFPPNTTLGLLLSQSIQTGRSIRNRRVPVMRDGSGEAGIAVVLLSVDFMDAKTGGSPGVVVRLRDPEATRQIGRQLQTADRLSAISKITGGVAHEVKNPLNAINMHVELVKMKIERKDYDIEPHIEIIASEIDRLNRVVKTFLDFTRPVELRLQEVPLDRFVQEIVDLAAPQASAGGIAVEVSQQTDDARLNVDADLLKQAVLNVVVNGIEAMKAGGRLRLESQVREDQAEIRISDTGPGIPEEMRDKIFGLYFTTKPGGSGIGLAMTYRIVQLHDGAIDFVSQPGQGTTFILHLPIVV